ncbi:MAG: hypothetical protein K9N49_07265, partial [Candidatus Marinimicrobia bacterium]|nr:hypothetical protein [Candidatus Neomarinimicrobiota bacterium]
MYQALTQTERERIDSIVSGLSNRQKIGQTFCINTGKQTPEQVAEIVAEYAIGGIYQAYRPVADATAVTAAAQAAAAVPVVAAADLVNGPGSRLINATLFPWQMAVGAADSEDLAEKM